MTTAAAQSGRCDRLPRGAWEGHDAGQAVEVRGRV
jgi:hypothetical protein